MPRLNKSPKTIRAYEHHGVGLTRQSEEQYVGDCPFCDGSDKFSVNSKTSQFKCWRSGCPINNANGEGTGGNAIQFLRRLHALSLEATPTRWYEDLGHERGYDDLMTLIEWQLAESVINSRCLVPAYNAERSMNQLYVRGDKLYPTPFPEKRSGIFGANLYSRDNQIVWLCEGPWDAMALWERLAAYKREGDGYARTSSRDLSLLSEMNVLAVPGLGAVGKPLESWAPLFAGKSVYVAFDNDHPRTNDRGALVPSAGWEGTLRAIRVLTEHSTPDEGLYAHWGDDGYDPNRPHNFDIRDLLCSP